MFRIYSEVCRKNIKIFLLPAVLAVLFLTVILFIVADPRNSTAEYAAVICQEFFAWAGIFLLSPVCMPEQRDNIEETVLSKAVPITAVYLIRLIEAIAALVLLTAAFIWLLSLLGGEIEVLRYFTHTVATAMLLGSLGFAGTRYTGNIGGGYIIAFGFYILQMFLLDEIIERVPHIYIFTLQIEASSIISIYALSFVFIVASFFKR